MTSFSVLLAVFAVFRLAWLVAREEGPFGAFVWLRERVDVTQSTWLGRGLNCPNCVSFWIALIVVLLCGGGWLEWLAIAGVVVMINKAMLK